VAAAVAASAFWSYGKPVEYNYNITKPFAGNFFFFLKTKQIRHGYGIEKTKTRAHTQPTLAIAERQKNL